jgi:hypothetical protein
MQQISNLNLRINDMMTQLNVVMKAMMEENAALKKEAQNSEPNRIGSKQGLLFIFSCFFGYLAASSRGSR